ncbi:phage tail protein [Kribbella monticola]|uniref:phage tail protein n=1 Tax=Kribbella monticola TaxID=2185285 RepID=UPI000DD3A5F4|nr:phage tail protein [Kribbella monticola]
MAPSLMSAGRALEQLSGQVAMSHRYVIDIDASNYQLGGWSKAAGLGVSWQKYSYRGGDATHDTLVPGNVSYPNVSLSRAVGRDSAKVQAWLVSVTRDRRSLSGAIHLVDFLGSPVVTWRLNEFFPIGWRLTEFDSAGSRPAIETLELCHTGFLPAEGRAK